MICSNTVSDGKYMDLFLKALPLQPYTEYELRFRALGGSCFVWINRYFASRGAEQHYTQPCAAWETHTIRFTTNSLSYKSEAAPDWCISFGKKQGIRCTTDGADTYLDDIALFKADAPQTDLLTGGDFTAQRTDDVYNVHWRQSFFGPAGDIYGVDIVTDPTDEHNRCIKLPALLKPAAHSELIPLRAEYFGWYKDNIDQITVNEPFGLMNHRLLIVQQGSVTGETGDTAFEAATGDIVYLPPNIPLQYTYVHGEGTTYYWIDFSGDPVQALLSECGLTAFAVRAVRDTAALTEHIDTMLTHPRDDAFYPYVLSSHLQLLLVALHQLLQIPETENRHPVIEQAAACLREFSSDPADNTALAERFSFSTRHFIRLFKQYKGCTPHQYYLQALMEKACTLLNDSSLTVQEVSYALGLEDAFYFSRLFRKFYGISPTEYRNLRT